MHLVFHINVLVAVEPTAAREITPATTIFILRAICRSLTMKIGRMPNVQSANEFRADLHFIKTR